MRVLIVGLGLIGKERLAALAGLRDLHELRALEVYVFDVNAEISQAVAHDRKEFVKAVEIDQLKGLRFDLVVFAVPHDQLVRSVCTCLGILHTDSILIEKPAGRTLEEYERLRQHIPSFVRTFVGFNYRYFEGVRGLIADFRRGFFGRLVAVDYRLGHGNSPQMVGSWKLDPNGCGELGCLIDPGIHLLDLAALICPDLVAVEAVTWKGFWNTGIVEHCTSSAVAADGAVHRFDMSLVRWRSDFSIEVLGVEGYGTVSGRGRTYGPQSYIRGRRWGWQGGKTQRDSEEVVVQASDCSNSFRDELEEILAALDLISLDSNESERLQPCTLDDARKSIELAQRFYASRKGP